jgi:tyrosyl-tRNA synthetase
VGDPSGRTKERDQLQIEMLERNLQGISENLSRIFNNYKELFDGNSGSPIQYDSKMCKIF